MIALRYVWHTATLLFLEWLRVPLPSSGDGEPDGTADSPKSNDPDCVSAFLSCKGNMKLCAEHFSAGVLLVGAANVVTEEFELALEKLIVGWVVGIRRPSRGDFGGTSGGWSFSSLFSSRPAMGKLLLEDPTTFTAN